MRMYGISVNPSTRFCCAASRRAAASQEEQSLREKPSKRQTATSESRPIALYGTSLSASTRLSCATALRSAELPATLSCLTKPGSRHSASSESVPITKYGTSLTVARRLSWHALRHVVQTACSCATSHSQMTVQAAWSLRPKLGQRQTAMSESAPIAR